MKPGSFQTLPFELRRSIITFHIHASHARHYIAPTRPIANKPAGYRGRTVPKRDEGPSPLSPFSRVTPRATSRPAIQPPVKGDSELAGKNTRSPNYKALRSDRKKVSSKKLPVKQSKSVTGTSPTRKLLVTPATDRESRVPVWARPPTDTSKPGAVIQPPTGTSWAEHRASIKEKYPGRWNPPKKISREAMDAIRELHKLDPEKYPTWVLAQRFTVSPDAVRRILRSKWRMSEDKVEEKIMKERMRRVERMKRMREEEMHQMVRAGIQLKVHPDDQLRLK